ncbi:RHS repeat-associated core domain-containing protein [Paraburkholderia humisilvae]|uniref:RHS repeat-associated core domain-containing protein n=1 Tax=Paraburkholderia humisilvae TaxID=627669 RepID=UPI00361F3F98
MQLILTDGRVINLKQDPDTQAFTIDTIYINDLVLKKSTDPDGYQVRYKDGITETLTKIGIGYYVTEIIHESGYKLVLEYGGSYDRAALTRIYDESGTSLVDITRTDTTDETGSLKSRECAIELYKGNADYATKMTLAISDDGSTGLSLRTCSVALTDTENIQTLSFSYLSPSTTIGFRVISQVDSNFAGPATEQISYQERLKLPDGFPWTTFPVAISYVLSLTSAGTGQTKSEVHTYEYGDDTEEEEEDRDYNNFLGYQEDTEWNTAAIDNLYDRDATYHYETTETLNIDGTQTSTIVREYDKFHRLYSEETSIPDTAQIKGRKIRVDYYYPGETTLGYLALPPQYKLPNRILTTFSETTVVSPEEPKTSERKTDQYFSYDEYGNLLQEKLIGGFTVDYAYYAAAGVPDTCPPEPNGFVRFLNTSKKYKTSAADNCITTTRTYTSTSMKDGSTFTVPATEEEKRTIAKVESTDYKKTKFEYFNTESDTGTTRGRLKSTLLQLSRENGVTTSYTYTLSADGTQLDIWTTETGVDGNTLTGWRTISCLTGVPTEITDNFGVSTSLKYDKFGRVTSHKRAPGTSFERTVTYSYAFDATSKLHSRTTTEPSLNAVKVTTDALGNIVKEEVASQVARTAEYNTQGWLVTEHRYDYDVTAADSTAMAQLDLVDNYYYDGFGELTRVVYHDNRETRRHFNIGSAILTEYTNVPVKQAETDVVTIYNLTRTSHDPGTLLPLTVQDYSDDKKTLISTTTYTYDEFFRLQGTKVVDAATQKQMRVALAYDFFDRVSTATDYDNDQPARVRGMQYWEYGVEPRIASMSVDDVTVATRTFDGIGRITKVDRNPANPGQSVTDYTYSDGYVTPATETTPRGIAIAHDYCPELGGVPTSTKPPEGQDGSFAYKYNKDIVKLIEQTYTTGTVVETRTLRYDTNALLIGEVSTLKNADGTTDGYQNGFSRTPLGRLKSVSSSVTGRSPQNDAWYGYDSAGRVATIGFRSGGAQVLKVTMSYAGGELLKSATYTFGSDAEPTATFRLDLSYDSRMRLTTKTYLRKGEDGTFTQCASSELVYNGLDQVNEQRFGAAAVTTVLQNQYDYAGRLSGSTASDATTVYPKDTGGNDVSEYTFGYDNYNNITSWSTKLKETGDSTSVACSYDGKNVFEMTKQVITRGSESPRQVDLTYDASGNISSVAETDGIITTCTYDCYEKLRTQNRSKPTDGNWRPTTAYFEYNSQGKLRSEKMTIPKGETFDTVCPTAFAYCNGRFVASLRKQQASDTDAQFATYLSGASHVDAIQCSRGNATAGYTKSPQMLFSDPSGSVYGAADPAKGTEIVPKIYNPYGSLSAAFDTSYDPALFKGQRFDPMAWLYHLGDGMRSYDSSVLLRFLQYDTESPFGEGGLNPYAYCEGDPVTFADSSGNSKAWVIGPVVASIGLLLGMVSFGMGAWAVVGGALALTSGLAFTGGVVALGGGATGLASALVDDQETVDQLTLASTVLLGLSAVLQYLPLGVHMLGNKLAAWRFVDRVSTARALTARSQFNKYSGTDFTVSATRVQMPGVAGNVRLVATHGSPGVLQFPVRSNRAANGAWQYRAARVTPEDFATELNHLLASEFGDTDGPIFLIACGGTRAGAINNAQAVATFSNRTVSAFPSSTVVGLWRSPPNTQPITKFTTYGWRWFPKAMTFAPA